MTDTINLNQRLFNGIQSQQYAGHDPFDQLNSRLLQATPLNRSAVLRLMWLQLGKRSPFNFRPLLRVPRKRNPKGIGLMISGLLQDYQRTSQSFYLNEACALGDWLLFARSEVQQWQHSCWGYHFDWQARAFHVPAGKPNIITTVYVARALFELGNISGRDEFRQCALDAADFIQRHLYTETDGRCFYAYIPGEIAFVHNASLWGAAWVAFVGKQRGDESMVNQALDVARQSTVEQRSDGAWVYGARHHHQFIDGFHTGYNLEALSMIREALAVSEFDDAIKRGYHFYVEHFFLPDGTAKYYHDNPYPLDTHSFAQAIVTLLKVGGREDDLALCQRVVESLVKQLYLPGRDYFAYQKHRWFTNRINYMRWTQAWAYYALAYYNHYFEQQD